MSVSFSKLDVPYDDKIWGNIIDPLEWNENFTTIENVFNKLVDDLLELPSISLSITAENGRLKFSY